MVGTVQYQNLEHTLLAIKQQVIDSLPYAEQNCTGFNTPAQLFDWMRSWTKYVGDPKGRELLQSLPTLIERNKHGTVGAGDCDCFTIAGLACLLANGFNDVYVILAGRNTFTPRHIYAGVKWNGKVRPFDLTNSYFDVERKNYSYKQVLPFRIRNNFLFDLYQ
jgi:hypothetical protein